MEADSSIENMTAIIHHGKTNEELIMVIFEARLSLELTLSVLYSLAHSVTRIIRV